jgi:UDP-2,3-diacylglucosamine hydrolase
MSTYFISDLHLSLKNPALFTLLDQFIRLIQKDAQELYILGDLFSLYLGIDVEQELLKKFHRHILPLLNKKCKVFFMPGNRDFLCRPADLIPFSIHYLYDPSPLVLKGIGGEKYPLLLMHGDSLSTTPPIYPLYRRLVRSPIFQTFFFLFPLRLRQAIASLFQRQSPSSPQNRKQTEILEKDRILKFRGHYPFMLHGHVHEAGFYERNRFVLSDWQNEKASCIHWNGEELRLLEIQKNNPLLTTLASQSFSSL